MGGLVSSHFLIYLLEVKVFQIHSRRVLDEVSRQELETFEVPVEEHSIVLFSLLESLHGLNSYGFDPLLAVRSCSSFSKVSYRLAPKSSLSVLTFSLAVLASSMAALKSFFNFKFSASKAATRDTADSTLAS